MREMKPNAPSMFEGIWDPMKWMLLFKQRELEQHGFERKRAQFDGVHFGYYLKPGEDKVPPLVLVHGMAIFPEWWSPLFPHLPSRYPLYAPELLGFGRSPGRGLDPGQFTLETYRQQLRLLKEELGLDTMILGGVSLGGWVCLDYALHYPEDVKGMVLLAPAGATPQVGEEERALTLVKEAYARGRPFDLRLHADMDLEPIRGNPGIEKLVRPKG